MVIQGCVGLAAYIEAVILSTARDACPHAGPLFLVRCSTGTNCGAKDFPLRRPRAARAGRTASTGEHNPRMGIRFRKRIKLFPGLWVNLSKSGASVSAGVKGFTVNSGRGKSRTTVGLPGTGVSYTTTTTTTTSAGGTAAPVPPPAPTSTGKPARTVRPLIWLALVLAIASTVYVVNFL